MDKGIDMLNHDPYHDSIDLGGSLANIAESFSETVSTIRSALGEKLADE
jgi:hypothetical protein